MIKFFNAKNNFQTCKIEMANKKLINNSFINFVICRMRTSLKKNKMNFVQEDWLFLEIKSDWTFKNKKNLHVLICQNS